MSEDQLQAKCYQWAYNTYPAIRGLLFSVPNGGTRNIIEATKLKATGLTPGIPDMILVWPRLIGFEFKTATGVLSDAQKKVHAIWRNNGIEVQVIRSYEQWEIVIKNILGNFR